MDAIVLAGGLGTRLASVLTELPKPMAPVGGRPWLEYVLDHLLECAISRVILSVGYKSEAIVAHFGGRYGRLPIEYCVETSPLGTGGAIRESLSMTSGDHVLVTNGDTLFKADIDELLDVHRAQGADVTIAVRYVSNSGRYGAIEFNAAGRVEKFDEKSQRGGGQINGGTYVVSRGAVTRLAPSGAFSFERDLLQQHLNQLHVVAVPSDGYFIDIGIPSDYQRAQSELNRAA